MYNIRLELRMKWCKYYIHIGTVYLHTNVTYVLVCKGANHFSIVKSTITLIFKGYIISGIVYNRKRTHYAVLNI